jgi:hypothetical protein
MRLPRRALFAAALFGAPATVAGASGVATLRPRVASTIGFAPLPRERVAFRAAGLEPAIGLPAPRARVAGLLPIAGRQVAVLAFGADPPGSGARLDLAAIVGWDGAALRVLTLEVLNWRAASGAWLATRFAATGDRMRLALTREAAAPRGALPWQREGWIDMLAWREGAALADAPPRPPAAGTWQARLASMRARVAARLAAPCRDVAEDLIRLLPPEALPPG